MEDSKIPYCIEHTRNRHSRAVYRDEAIVIRLARNLTKTEENDHIKNLLKRMTMQVLKDRERSLIHPFEEILKGASDQNITLSSGAKYTYVLKPSTRTHVKKLMDEWHIYVGQRLKRTEFHRLLWKTIAKEHLPALTELVQSINERTLNVKVTKVRVCFFSSQWGSCSTNGTIALNAALLFVPHTLLEYVIIHELAHRKYTSHSTRYWKLVESVCPWYKEARKTLKNYRLPTL